MTLTKQTVYLPVNTNYEYTVKRLNNYHVENNVVKKELFVFTPEQLNEYIANVIKQALGTAAEKGYGIHCTDYIDKQSITKTFEETFKKFEV